MMTRILRGVVVCLALAAAAVCETPQAAAVAHPGTFVDDVDGADGVKVASWKPPGEPQFVPEGIKNVTVPSGETAFLNCRVRNIGNKTVSWIRHRDIHILTTGAYTYTTDDRFSSLHHPKSEDWTLRILRATPADSGLYECQLSTQPIRSVFINLSVIVAVAEILGETDRYVNHGSMINLTCVVKNSPVPPEFVYWYHDSDVISFDSKRGGVSMITDKGPTTSSYLLIQGAHAGDAGKYTCSPSNSAPVSIRVHVLNEHQAAMKQNGASARHSLLLGKWIMAWAPCLLVLALTMIGSQSKIAR